MLTGGDITRTRNLDEITSEFGNLSCFVLSAIGRICCASERTTRGVEAYKRALRINPFLWQSYEQLCRLGEKPEANKIFTISNLENLSHITGTTSSLINQTEVGMKSDAPETNLNLQ